MRRSQPALPFASTVLMLALAAIPLDFSTGQSPEADAQEHEPAAPPRPAIIPGDAAEIEIAYGRLRLMPRRYRIVRRQETAKEPAVSRSVQVTAVDGRPTLRARYVDQSEKWSLQFDAVLGAQWSREMTVGGRALKVDYSQRPQQPIFIAISGLGASPKQMTGATLWHLTEQNRPEFTDYILPSLARLNSSWNLPQTLAMAKQFREQSGLAADRIDQAALVQCVTDLESSDRELRTSAVEQLRVAGVTAHIPLVELSQRPLTTQQRKTVEQLLSALEPRSADTPTRLAYWLSGDPSWR